MRKLYFVILVKPEPVKEPTKEPELLGIKIPRASAEAALEKKEAKTLGKKLCGSPALVRKIRCLGFLFESLKMFFVRSRLSGGVVHSFDGSAEDRDSILALGRHMIHKCILFHRFF